MNRFQNPEPPDEPLACFDEQGNPIESHARKEIHVSPPNYWHAVVNIWLVDKTGRLLCTKRSDTLGGNPGKWQTYLGGHVKAGKTYQEAAVMEMEEEVGFMLDPGKLVLIQTGKHEPSKHFFESYAYPFDGTVSDLKFQDGEITEAKWMTMEEYNKQKEEHPEMWCNGCNPENQEKIWKMFVS